MSHRFATLAVHAGHVPDTETHARAVPIYASTSFTFDSTAQAAAIFALEQPGNIYSRLGNPTCDVLEKRIAALDGGVAAVAFASGQAAVMAAVVTLAKPGQNIVVSNSLYGGTSTLFRHTLGRLGIEFRFFDTDNLEALHGLIDADTRAVYTESLANPRNNLPDFHRLAEIAHAHGVPVLVDNTVLTPALFRPLDHGADIVLYSATKYLGGHGTHVAGLLVDGGRFDWTREPDRWPELTRPDPTYHGIAFAEKMGAQAFAAHVRTHWLRDTGACLSPFGAFLILQGIETLHLRMPRHAQNAAALADFLAAHPAVAAVTYAGRSDHPDHAKVSRYFPQGAGAIIGFRVKGGYDAAVRFIDTVKLCSHLANIGDAKTLVIHPASTTHGQLTPAELETCGISADFIRLSVGIEDIDDLKQDLDQALGGRG